MHPEKQLARIDREEMSSAKREQEKPVFGVPLRINYKKRVTTHVICSESVDCAIIGLAVSNITRDGSNSSSLSIMPAKGILWKSGLGFEWACGLYNTSIFCIENIHVDLLFFILGSVVALTIADIFEGCNNRISLMFVVVLSYSALQGWRCRTSIIGSAGSSTTSSRVEVMARRRLRACAVELAVEGVVV